MLRCSAAGDSCCCCAVAADSSTETTSGSGGGACASNPRIAGAGAPLMRRSGCIGTDGSSKTGCPASAGCCSALASAPSVLAVLPRSAAQGSSCAILLPSVSILPSLVSVCAAGGGGAAAGSNAALLPLTNLYCLVLLPGSATDAPPSAPCSCCWRAVPNPGSPSIPGPACTRRSCVIRPPPVQNMQAMQAGQQTTASTHPAAQRPAPLAPARRWHNARPAWLLLLPPPEACSRSYRASGAVCTVARSWRHVGPRAARKGAGALLLPTHRVSHARNVLKRVRGGASGEPLEASNLGGCGCAAAPLQVLANLSHLLGAVTTDDSAPVRDEGFQPRSGGGRMRAEELRPRARWSAGKAGR